MQIYFENLRTRLITQVRVAIQSGEVTERGLASQIGVSQPHLHNVLKGVRALTPEMADRLLGFLSLSVHDLLDTEREYEPMRIEPTHRVPLVECHTLCDVRWPVFVTAMHPVPAALLKGLVQPAVTQLPVDGDMIPDLLPGALGLVEAANVPRTANQSRNGLYLISIAGCMVLRWVRSGARSLYLADTGGRHDPAAWLRVPLSLPDWDLILTARVVSVAMPPGYKFQAVSVPRAAN